MVEEGFPLAANYSWDEFAVRCVLNGRFPLWNPYQSCGNTFLANYLPAFLFVPRWLVFLSDGAFIRDLYVLLRFWVGGLSLYIFARRSLSIYGSAMTVMSFLGVGYFTRYYNENYLNIDLMLGLWLLATDSLIQRRTIKSALLFSLTVCAVLLGGHPESAFHILLLISLWIVYRTFAIYRFSRNALLTLLLCAGSGIIGFFIASAQLLPFLETFSQSANYHIPHLGRYHYELKHIASLIFPWLYGDFSTYLQNKTLPQINNQLSYASTTINWLPPYLGLLPLLFATVGIIKINKLASHSKFFAIYLIVALGGVFGIPPFNQIFALPPLYMVGNYKHIFPELTLACAMLAGMSLELLVSCKSTARHFLIPIAVGFLLVGFYGTLKSAQSEVSYLIIWGVIPLFVVSGILLWDVLSKYKIILILAVSYITLLSYTFGYTVQHQGYLLGLKYAPFVNYLQGVAKEDRFISLFPHLLPTFGPWLEISDVRGHDALHGREYWEILERVNSLSLSESAEFFYSSGGFGPLPEALGNNLLDNLRLKYIVSPADLGGMIAVSSITRRASILAEARSSFKWEVWEKDDVRQPVLFVHPPLKVIYDFSLGEEAHNLEPSLGWSPKDNLESSDGAFIIVKDYGNDTTKISYARHLASWEKHWIKSAINVFPEVNRRREIITLPMLDKYHDWLGIGIKNRKESFWGFQLAFPPLPTEIPTAKAHFYLWNDILVYEKPFLPPLFSLAFDEHNLNGGNPYTAKQIAPDEYLFSSNPDKPFLVALGFSYRPGWKLFCNGEVKIERLPNFSFYAKLPIAEGDKSCELRLRYIPFGFRISLWVTMMSLLCLICLFPQKIKSLLT